VGGLSASGRSSLVSCLVLALGCALGAADGASASPTGTASFFSAGITPASHPAGITAGPDGNLWFTESDGDRVGRITPTGAVTEFSAGISPGSAPQKITAGPDGNLWFTESEGARIGRITPAGVVTEFATGIKAASEPWGIVTGPDGNLWFTERLGDQIGRITPAGVVTQFPLEALSRPAGITKGPDGNLWFAEQKGGKIGRMTPAGNVTAFSAGMKSGSEPLSIAAGADGNLWFVALNGPKGELGRVTPAGTITESPFAFAANAIAAGADGSLWAAEPYEKIERAVRITPSQTITEFPFLPPSPGFSEDTAPGPDGNLWFTKTGEGSGIGRIASGAPAADVSPPALTGGARAGMLEQCSAAQWSTWASQQPSSTLFAFDGYRWLLDGSVIATGTSYTPTASNVGHALSCTETVTYPLLNVSVSAASAATTVPAPAAVPISAPVLAPILSSLAQSSSRWREGRRLARLSRRGKPPVGTTFTFTINESANVTFTFTQSHGGRRLAGRCVAQAKANRHRPSCRRTLVAGTLSFAAHAGVNKVAFQGRLSAAKRLPVGRYTLVVFANSTAGLRSQTKTLSFNIVG